MVGNACTGPLPWSRGINEVRYATKRQKDYKLADGEGLYVLVRPNGSKMWRLKYRFAGKEKLLSLALIQR